MSNNIVKTFLKTAANDSNAAHIGLKQCALTLMDMGNALSLIFAPKLIWASCKLVTMQKNNSFIARQNVRPETANNPEFQQ